MDIIVLGLLGLCFGSFVNALVWRIYMQDKEAKDKRHKVKDQKLKSKKLSTVNFNPSSRSKYSITTGRSMCVNCKHVLSSKDLLPVVSWVSLSGKCRYCKKPISVQYPLVELSTAILFVLSYILWPYDFSIVGTLSLVLWLVILVGLIALFVYDLKWMLLPNRILFPLYFVAAGYVASRVVAKNDVSLLSDFGLAAIIGGGIFYLLFQLSGGKWIGGGDVKLGFLLGVLAGTPVLALLALFIASFLGSLFSIPLILSGKATKSSKIPFGPFLIIAAVIMLFYGTDLASLYSQYVLKS